MKVFKKKFFYLSFFCFLLIFSCFIVKNRHLNLNYQESSLSLSNIKIFNRFTRQQFLYYIEHSNFDPNIAHVIEAESYDFAKTISTYNYSFKIKNNIAYMYAIPKNTNERIQIFNLSLWQNKERVFHGYVGAIFMKNVNPQDGSSLVASRVICQNTNFGTDKPSKPVFFIRRSILGLW